MGLGIPPLIIMITLASNPQKSTMLVGGLAERQMQGDYIYIYIYIHIYIYNHNNNIIIIIIITIAIIIIL